MAPEDAVFGSGFERALRWARAIHRVGAPHMSVGKYLAPMAARGVFLFLLAVLTATASRQTLAEKQETDIAGFAALDKVTARISPLEIPIGKTSRFGALKVTPRVCYIRPPTEPPLTSAFVEVDEIKLNGSEQRIFTGWMFAQSPGLHAVEHPVFDVWLTNCKMKSGDASLGKAEKSASPDSAASRRR